MLQCNTIGSVFVASAGAVGVWVDDAGVGDDGCEELEQPARAPPNNRVRQVASVMPFFIVIPLEENESICSEYFFLFLKAI